MAFTVTARGNAGNNTAATSISFSPSANIASGSTIVVVIAYDNSGSGGSDPYSSISNTGTSITWSSIEDALYDPGAASAGVTLRIFMGLATGGLLTSNSITVSFGSSSTTAKAYVIYELTSNVPGASISFVQGNSGTGAATGTPTITTGTITSGNLVIGAGGAESGTAWTGDADTTNGSWSTAVGAVIGSTTSGMSVTSQYKQVTATATQTYNPTLTSADCILAWVELTEASGGFDPMGTLGFFGL